MHGVVGGGGWSEECLGEGLGEGAARYGDLEGIVAGEARSLGLDYVGSQSGGQGIDGGEGEEIGLSSHIVVKGKGGVIEICLSSWMSVR